MTIFETTIHREDDLDRRHDLDIECRFDEEADQVDATATVLGRDGEEAFDLCQCVPATTMMVRPTLAERAATADPDCRRCKGTGRHSITIKLDPGERKRIGDEYRQREIERIEWRQDEDAEQRALDAEIERNHR